jgi:glycerol-3-phosphate dehydrogenase (NAD(P)+)
MRQEAEALEARSQRVRRHRLHRQRIGILGAGAWGTAIGGVLAGWGHRVELWCREPEVAEEINHRRSNSRFLVGVELPPGLHAGTDPLETASHKDYLLVAVPSAYLLDVVRKVLFAADILEGNTLIGVLAKGFVETPQGIRLITEAVENVLPGIYKDNLVYISGPSHAEEVARGKLTGLISASRNGANAIRFRELLNAPPLAVYSSLDVRGVQIAAAVKNVIAIAFGMLDALSEFSEQVGDNTESLLLAAGLNEIQRLGLAMGATHPETFTSIAGVGDLEVTCRSKYGRNRRFGREIILTHLLERFRGIEDLISHIDSLGYLPEGVLAAKYTRRLAEQYEVSLPICQVVFQVLNRETDPLQVVDLILKRMA